MNLGCSDAEDLWDFYKAFVRLLVVLVWKQDKQIWTNISPLQ